MKTTRTIYLFFIFSKLSYVLIIHKTRVRILFEMAGEANVNAVHVHPIENRNGEMRTEFVKLECERSVQNE